MTDPAPTPQPEPPHKWDVCSECGPMVRCGYCGNNCCNGGSNDGCPDKCASAYEMQSAGQPSPSRPVVSVEEAPFR